MIRTTLTPSLTEGSVVEGEAGNYRLEIPAGEARRYRLAQVDDYHNLRRRDFAWQPPLRMSLRTRASHTAIPGTWGFGLWNDPFSMSLLGGQGARRLPVLPQCAWFFYAGAPNWLSLREDRPGDGLLAATFRAAETQGSRSADRITMLAALPLLALLPAGGPRLHAARRQLRQAVRRVVAQDAAQVSSDPTAWHNYQIDWQVESVAFTVDGECVLDTPLAPTGSLGCVIWVDNQYLAFTPPAVQGHTTRGGIRYGMLASTEAAWIEVEGLELKTLDQGE